MDHQKKNAFLLTQFDTDFNTEGAPCQNTVAFNAQGTLLATGGEDGIVRMWTVPKKTKKEENKTVQLEPFLKHHGDLNGHTDYLRAVHFNASGTLVRNHTNL